jgi:hypothetical protein
MSKELEQAYKQWLIGQLPQLNSQTSQVQLTWAMNALRRIVPGGSGDSDSPPPKCCESMDEVTEMVASLEEGLDREMEETRSYPVRTAIKRFLHWVRGESLGAAAAERSAEEEEEEAAAAASLFSAMGSSSGLGLGEDILTGLMRYISSVASIQEVTIRDYVVKVNGILASFMERVGYEGGIIEEKKELQKFYRANEPIFLEYMQALGVASQDRAKRSALRYLMNYLGMEANNAIWARGSAAAMGGGGGGNNGNGMPEANYRASSRIQQQQEYEEEDEDDYGDDDGGGVGGRTRDVKILGDEIRSDFKFWLMQQTRGNSRPLAEATAKEHMMSMNNLVRRAIQRTRGAVEEHTIASLADLRSFILGNLAAFKAEAARLTYGRITAYRYFVKYVGVEDEVTGRRPVSLPPATGGGGGAASSSSSSRLILLSKVLKKRFKKWLRQQERGPRLDKEKAEGFLTIALYILHQTYNRALPEGSSARPQGGSECVCVCIYMYHV